MATQLQIRRGTTAQMTAFTGAEGEIAVNTSTDTVHVHDGSTAGGFALAKADGSNIGTYAGSFTTLAASGASTLTGAVGINIAPTSYKLTVNSGATTETTAAAIGYNGDAGTNLYINTDHGNNLVSLYASGSASKEMRFMSGTLEVMRLGTTGNVGIGTSSPAGRIDAVVDSTGGLKLTTNTDAGVTLTAYQGSTNANVRSLDIDAQNFVVNTGAPTGTTVTERLRLDSAGLVGINNPNPAQTLSICNPANPNRNGMEIAIGASDTSSNTIQNYNRATGAYTPLNIVGSILTFGVGPSALEKARITSAGNLLVGKTSTGINTAGHELFASGEVFHSVAGTPLYVNRIGSDGPIQNFYKDGTTVGSIGAQSGRLTVGSNSAAGVRFDGTQLVPMNGASISDNTITLGDSGFRFKDLYLSGVMAAGNGSATVPSVRGTDTNTGLFFPSGGVTAITRNGVEALRMTSAGKLVVNGTVAGYSGTGITVGSPSAVSSGLSILSTTAGAGYLLFGDTTGDAAGGYSGQINYAHSTNRMGINTNNLERMAIDSSGNVMVGTASQYFARLSVQGEAFQNAVTVRVGTNGYPAINFQNTSAQQQGYIVTNASSVQYISISDQRAKENIADADDAGSKIDSIQVRKFDWIVDGSHQDYGMIAQELQAVAPEAVSGDSDSENMMGVDYSKLVPMLVKEIQSLRTRVQELENN